MRGRGGGRRETDLAGVTQQRGGALASGGVAEPLVWRRRTGDISFPLTVSLLFNICFFVIKLPSLFFFGVSNILWMEFADQRLMIVLA